MAIRVERRENHGVLVLDRPEKAHAYDRAHLDALAEGFEKLAQDYSVIVVQATGERAFCAGADLAALDQADPLDALDLRSQRVFTAIAHSPAITVAAVHGPAIAGGFELVLACDLRVVGPGARFRLPETRLGIIPSAGGTSRLTRLCGASVAKQVILAGRELDADDAVRFGLALERTPDPRARAHELAEMIAGRDPVALRLAKQIIDLDGDEARLTTERLSEAFLYSRRQP